MNEFNNKILKEYQLPDFEDVVLMQTNIQEGLAVVLNLLDTRYIETVLQELIRCIIANIDESEWSDKYLELLGEFSDQDLQNAAVIHAMYETEGNPDTDDIPQANKEVLHENYQELDLEMQKAILFTAYTIKLMRQMNTQAAHPFKAVYEIFLQCDLQTQQDFTSKVMKQYVRQFHNTRMSRN